MASRWIVTVLLTVAGLGGTAIAATPESAQGVPPWDLTPPRVSYLSGEVSFWRPGTDDWTSAQLNTPLAPGDLLHVGGDGAVEAQIGPRDFVRAAAGTQLGLDHQDTGSVRFRVTAGYAAVDRRALPPGYTVVLTTPAATITFDEAGSYRVGVGAEVTSVVAFGGGTARVTAADGRTVHVAPGQQVILTGTEAPSLAISAAPAPSAWDRWSDLRTDAFRSVASASYVPSGVYGTEQLDQYGTWNAVEPYGRIWIPTAVPAGWAPYTSGRWIWDPRFGWTWVDDSAWGWAPFHYGRWVFVRERWGWVPGPIVVRPVYAPALVAFLDVPVVVGRPVCWVALGWGEPVTPWWGGPGFAGRPWWGGWGGPRIVNNVVVNRTTTVTGGDVTVYRNMSVPSAVVVVPAERFARDPVARARIARVDVSQLRPARDPIPAPRGARSPRAEDRPSNPPVVREGNRVSSGPAGARAPKPPETLHTPLPPPRARGLAPPPARPAAVPRPAAFPPLPSPARQAPAPARPEGRWIEGRAGAAPRRIESLAPPRVQAPAPPVRMVNPPAPLARPPAGSQARRPEDVRPVRVSAAAPAAPRPPLPRPQPVAGRPDTTKPRSSGAPGLEAPVPRSVRAEAAGQGPRRSTVVEPPGRPSRPPVERGQIVTPRQERPGRSQDIGQ